MDDLARKLNFKEPKDWYNLTAEILSQNGGNALRRLYGYSIPTLVQTVYPEYPTRFVDLAVKA
jgi:hypothetical protein